MSFDSSRFTFDSWNNFLGVVMQQGRVQLDSDWNEWLAEFARRIQAGTLDIVGRAVVPSTTPNAFQITIGTDSSGNSTVEIGPGRMYIDGLLAENHGHPKPRSQKWIPPAPSGSTPSLAWDPALAELVGSNPVGYLHQPYLPAPPPFPQSGGPYLLYLDLWQREVTFLEYPDMVEKAVGIDTTGRLQTVWQVKWLSVPGGATCSAPGAPWTSLVLPSGGRLTTGVASGSASGPCCLTPNTGFTGLENQLYRVEIHRGGSLSGATFKWSRDNASVATGVTGIAQSGTVLTVQSTGKDSVLGFAANQWVEITDDWRKLHGRHGELRQIQLVNSAAKTITLTAGVSTSDFPLDSNGQTAAYRHTRVTLWNGSTAETAVSSSPITLENGITVSFGLASGEGTFKTGDYWVFAARASDGTVEFLDAAPPRGIHHHYAQLSVVDFSSAPIPSAGATETLYDQSPTPKPVLSFQANNPGQWPAFFGVSIQANASNSSNFDLEVVHNAIAADSASATVVESFSDLSLTTAPGIINKQSNFIRVAPLSSPPSTLTFPASFSASQQVNLLASSPQLMDVNSVPFLNLSLAPWPPALTVSASPGGTQSTFDLEIVYANGSRIAVLESHQNVSPGNLANFNSEFITALTWLGQPDSLAGLQLLSQSDCRIPWPSSASGCCECGCTISAKPGDDLQKLLDQYQNVTAPTGICLAAGTYSLTDPLQFTSQNSNLTLKACATGTVTLQAQSGSENNFGDGMIVLNSASSITIEGLNFSIPWSTLVASASNFEFAGWSLNQLDPNVAGAVTNLAVAIGIRSIDCTSLSIEHCKFTFTDPSALQSTSGNTPAPSSPVLFGAAIFAEGTSEGLDLSESQFTGGQYFSQGFVTGFLSTPAVTFNNLRLIPRSGIPRLPSVLSTETIAPTAATAQVRERAVEPNIPLTNFGAFTQQDPPAYAIRGGSVFAASLDDAIFSGNSFTQLTVAVMILAESKTIRFEDNRVSNCGAGFWRFSPLTAGWLLLDAHLSNVSSLDYFLLAGISTAMAYPLPQGVTITGTAVAAAPSATFVHASTKSITDSVGDIWNSDASSVSAGTTHLADMDVSITNSQPGTTPADQDLYKAFRWGENFTYTFSNLAAGYYTVTLKFADIAIQTRPETALTADPNATSWTFSICVNGLPVSSATVKVRVQTSAAQDIILSDIATTNVSNGAGQITIQFAAAASSQAMVCAIELNPQWSQSASNPNFEYNGFENFYSQLAALVQQAYPQLTPARLHVLGNEMYELSSVALLILGEDEVENGISSSLMLTGNQLSNSIQARVGYDQNSLQGTQLVSARTDYFLVTAAIVSITRCVVSSNMIVNEWSAGTPACGATAAVRDRISFLLDDRPPLTGEIAVMANVFQGAILISPAPHAGSWSVFNSVTA